jgi:hypothetical protein
MLGAAMSGWTSNGVGMKNDLAVIASRTKRHASESRYRAEDLVYEAGAASFGSTAADDEPLSCAA